MRGERLRPAQLARRVLLPPLLAGTVFAGLLVMLATTAGGQRAKADNALAAGRTPDLVTLVRSMDLEGALTATDILRARKPLSERKRLLARHPYFELYKQAKRRFGVPWVLVASVHYQETGFRKAPARLARDSAWRRYRFAALDMDRPASYLNRSEKHPSVRDDFDVVMAIAADLKDAGVTDLGAGAMRATAARYGAGAKGDLSTAMVVERARAWKLLGTLPLPGRGELATPVKGIIGGCGYFGCPRPGHLHNGVDLLAPTGTPVHAVEMGRVAVLEAVDESSGYGNFVCIQHRPHLASCYAHLSAIAANVTPGATVQRGQVIGLVGSTGSSSAPHLHFEVRRGPAECSTCAVDPLPFLSGEVPEAAVPELVDTPTTTTAQTTAPASMCTLAVSGSRAPCSRRSTPPRCLCRSTP